MLDFDPQPKEMVRSQAYSSFFSSLCVNFQALHPSSSTSLPMHILETIAPANIYALAHDHDYSFEHGEEMFLKDIGVQSISSNQSEDIEKATRQQSSDKRWHSERCVRLTSSNFGKLCKLTDRADKQKLVGSMLTPKKPNTIPI